MTDRIPPEKAAERIEQELDRMKKSGGHLEGILDAFRGLLVEQARLGAELPVPGGEGIDAPDKERFAQGVPLAGREQLIAIGENWKSGAERLIPPMMKGFPAIAETLGNLLSLILDGSFEPDGFSGAVLGRSEKDARQIPPKTALDPEAVKFALFQIARPFIARRSKALGTPIENLPWNRGYCPICGSLPELSLLKGKEGQRWLRCGFCSNEWRFVRLACPCCETPEADRMELLFVEGREYERLSLCLHCKKYVAEIDLRNMVKEPVVEIAGLGLLHLDVLARQKGFQPMGGGWWGVP